MPQLSRRAFAGALPLGLIGGSLLGGGLLGDSTARAATQEAAKAPVAVNPFAQIRIGLVHRDGTDGRAAPICPATTFRGAQTPRVERAASAQFTARPTWGSVPLQNPPNISSARMVSAAS